MFRLRELATQAITATSDDPEGNLLDFNTIFGLLDVQGSRNGHLVNPLNHPRRGAIRPRDQYLDGDEVVNGQYLSLIYCSHDPFILLIDYDGLASLEADILGRRGLLNPDITYFVSFISQKIAKYRITYDGPGGTVLQFDKYSQHKQFNWNHSVGAHYPNPAIEWI